MPARTPDHLRMCPVQPSLKDSIKGRPSVWMPDLRRHTQLCLLQGPGVRGHLQAPGRVSDEVRELALQSSQVVGLLTDMFLVHCTSLVNPVDCFLVRGGVC